MNLQPTIPPNSLRAGHRRCRQTQCGFFRSGYCQPCQKGNNCLARPYEINELCRACIACENQPNYLRFGDDNLDKDMMNGVKQEVEQPNGVILIYNSKPSPEHIRQEEEIAR